MRMMLAFALAGSGALADDVEDVHRLALQLLLELPRARGFAAGYQGHVNAGFLRQNFRITLLNRLNLQFP